MNSQVLLSVVSAIAAGAAVGVYSRQERIGRYSAIQTAFASLTAAFLTYPQLRPVFYEDEAIPSDSPDLADSMTRLRANIVAEAFLDALLLTLAGRNSRKKYKHYREGVFTNSAFLTAWVRTHRQWYDGRLVSLADQAAAAALNGSAGRGR